MSVVVGRVLCDGKQAIVHPEKISSTSIAPFDAETLLNKLDFIVRSAVGDSFDALRAVRSGFWTFVEAADRGAH